MRALLVVAALLATGCVAQPVHVRTVLLGGPTLAHILPNASALPPGFHVGWEQPGGPSRGVTALNRVYDYEHNNETVRHSITATVMQFDDPQMEQAQFDAIASGFTTASTRWIGPDRVESEQGGADAADPASFFQVKAEWAREGPYLLYVAENTPGEQLLSDPGAILDAMAARAHPTAD